MNKTPAVIPANTRKLMTAACSGMFVFGIVMAILGAILPGLFAKVGFDKGAAGDLFLTMNFAMLVMTLLFGPMVDRFGFKVLLIASALLVAGAFFLLSVASTYGLILAAAVVLGFGGGGLNGGTNALTSDIHEAEKRGPALNVLGVFFGFGALTIPFLIGTLLAVLGMGKILLMAVVLSLVPLVLFAASRFPRAKQAQGFPIKDAARIGRDPLLWLCAFLLFFQSGNEFTVGGWISTHLQETLRGRARGRRPGPGRVLGRDHGRPVRVEPDPPGPRAVAARPPERRPGPRRRASPQGGPVRGPGRGRRRAHRPGLRGHLPDDPGRRRRRISRRSPAPPSASSSPSGWPGGCWRRGWPDASPAGRASARGYSFRS